MRIDLNGISPTGVERDDKTKKPAGRASAASVSEDRATLSSDSLSVSSLAARALESPEVRSDRVEALRQAIQRGQYQVEPEQIAQAMLAQNRQ